MESNQPLRQCIIPLHRPSLKEYAFFFLSGIVISFPFAFFFESISPVSIFVLYVILGPFIEELAKVFPLFYRHGETESSIVNLGILLGLGFGLTELLEYVFFAGAPLIIRIPGVVFHPSLAAITAYGIAKKNPWPFYLLAATFHGLNNFLAVESVNVSAYYANLLFLADLLILVVAYLVALHLYRRTSKETMVV